MAKTTEKEVRQLGGYLIALHAMYPNIRLGQMIINAVRNTTDVDLYYISNEELLKCLEKYCERSGV